MEHLPRHPDWTDYDRASWAATERREQERREEVRRRGLPHIDRWQKTLCSDLRNPRLRDLAAAAAWGFCWRATVADGVDEDTSDIGAFEAIAIPEGSTAVVRVIAAWDIEDDPEAFQQQVFSLAGACQDVAQALVEGMVEEI